MDLGATPSPDTCIDCGEPYGLRHLTKRADHAVKPSKVDLDAEFRKGAMEITDLVIESHARSVAKGFWEASDNLAEKLMLVVSELAEAMEELRNPYSDPAEIEVVDGKPEGFLVELADAMIRLADIAGFVSRDPSDFSLAIGAKSAYNETRPHLHGRTR